MIIKPNEACSKHILSQHVSILNNMFRKRNKNHNANIQTLKYKKKNVKDSLFFYYASTNGKIIYINVRARKKSINEMEKNEFSFHSFNRE